VSRPARAQLREAPLGRLLAELARRAAAAPFLLAGALLARYEACIPRSLQVLGALAAGATVICAGVNTDQGALAALAGPLGAAALLRAATRSPLDDPGGLAAPQRTGEGRPGVGAGGAHPSPSATPMTPSQRSDPRRALELPRRPSRRSATGVFRRGVSPA
jgi:hypothetical protein